MVEAEFVRCYKSSVVDLQIIIFTQYIRYCLHFNQKTVSKRAVCRAYWYEQGDGVNIVLFYFGKPFMNVRIPVIVTILRVRKSRFSSPSTAVT